MTDPSLPLCRPARQCSCPKTSKPRLIPSCLTTHVEQAVHRESRSVIYSDGYVYIGAELPADAVWTIECSGYARLYGQQRRCKPARESTTARSANAGTSAPEAMIASGSTSPPKATTAQHNSERQPTTASRSNKRKPSEAQKYSPLRHSSRRTKPTGWHHLRSAHQRVLAGRESVARRPRSLPFWSVIWPLCRVAISRTRLSPRPVLFWPVSGRVRE
jgi:hypothetical protein